MRQHTVARLATQFKQMLMRSWLTDHCMFGIKMDNALSNCWMTRKVQWTLEFSRLQWTALRDHIPFMAHFIQLPLWPFMNRPCVEGGTKSSEAHEREQQFNENDGLHIGKNQRLQKEGNARIHKVSAIRPGVAMIIEKVRISLFFDYPDTNLHEAENACWIYYFDSWPSNGDQWLSKFQSLHRATSNYGCDDAWELNTGVAPVHLQITGIVTQVAPKPKIQWISANFHNSKLMKHCTRSWPASVSPKLVNHSFQVHLQTHSKKVSKRISEFNLIVAASKCISKVAWTQLPTASPKSLDRGFQIHLQTRSIAASKCISNLARSRPQSVSLSSWIVIFRRTSKLGWIEYLFGIMRCRSTPGSPIYTLPDAESISVIPLSPNIYIWRDLD